MPAWIRNLLFAVVMACAAIIGARVYLDLVSDTETERPLAATNSALGVLPEFTLNDLYGEPRDIREWAGQPLLINFWATWCAPCRREIPLLQQLHTEKRSTGIQVIGIAIDRLSDVETFTGEFGVSYPNLVGEADAMQVSGLFGLDGLGLPFTVLAAADGNVLDIHLGEIEADQLREMISIMQAYESGNTDLDTARTRLGEI